MGYNQETDRPVRSIRTGLERDDSPATLLGAPDDRVPLRLYMRIVWNRHWLILTLILTTMLLSAVRTLKQKPVYRALGTLEIEMPSKSVGSMQDLFASTNVPDTYLQTQSKILVSEHLTGQVIEELKVANEKNQNPSSRWVEHQAFQRRLDVQVMKGSQLVQVAFESEDPSLAAKVVNRLMNLYIKQIQDERHENASEGSKWVLDQIKDSKAKLQKSMDALHQYEQEHKFLSVDPNRDRLTSIDSDRLQQLEKELAIVQGTVFDKKALYERIQAGDSGMLQSVFLEENMKKEADLEGQLAQLSRKFGPKFPEVQRVQTNLAEVRRILADERQRLSKDIEAVYQNAVEQEETIQTEIEGQRKRITGGSDQLMQDNILKRDVDLNEQAYEGLLQKLQETTTAASLKTVNARIVDLADPPITSRYPGLAQNLGLSLLIGLFAGVGFAFFEDHLRDTIKTPGELELDLKLPLLGVIPAVNKLTIHTNGNGKRNGFHIRGKGRRFNDKPESGHWFRLDRDGLDCKQVSEAIRNIRTSIMFALDGKQAQSILFSSSGQSEGKTTISSNISISLAQLGKRILMIDGDLRRPCLHKVFSIADRPGLSEYLNGSYEWNDVVQSSKIPGLDVIVCGERPVNPAEMLSSERMRRVIEQAKSKYDLVVVDSPILVNMADSRILASYVNFAVLVVRSRSTPKLLAKQACANLRDANAQIMGVVLNQLEIGDSEYSYSYSYYEEASS